MAIQHMHMVTGVFAGFYSILQLSGQAFRSASSPMEHEPFPLGAARIRAPAGSSNAWRPGRIRHAHLLAA
eukprot:4525670-Pleurochrysis_carterae.AAC.1